MVQASSGDIDLRRPLLDRLSPLIGAALIAPLALGMMAAGVWVVSLSVGLALFMVAIGAFMAFLCVVCWREHQTRRMTRLRIVGGELQLFLPRNALRPALETSLPLASIRAIDTREEAYRTWGMTVMHRAYALVTADGSRLVLGGDRPMMDPFFGRAAGIIGERAGVALNDLGTYDAKAKLFEPAGTTAPAWEAQALSAPEAEKRRRRAAFTWSLVGASLTLVILARIISAMFGGS